ncbi:hypothetical protein DKL61_05510 [Gammaproteobacteria bacterium ESL0073]|nr:hypothetical protein DKL61_05510 [Gammaproteobacteria bacterium ESL0073]
MIARLRYSLTFRLALMFSLSALAVLLLLGFAVLYVVNQHFISQDRMMLEAQSQHIAQSLHQVDTLSQVSTYLGHTVSENAHSEHGFIIVVANAAGDVLFNSSPTQNLSALALPSKTLGAKLSTLHQNDISYRILTKPMTIANQKAIVLVALNINHHQTFLTAFKTSMWISIAVAALIMGLLACIVAQKGLKPLHLLMAQTEQITINNLSQPLPMNSTYLEISQLTATFNAMLDRLNNSFQRLVGFSSDLAHELRTPLSTMKMQNQVILSRSRTVEEYQQALHDNAQALDQMTRMVTDMLFLAKSDNGLICPEETSFALHDEINTLLDFYDYLAQEKNITLHLSGQGKLHGDKSLLQRALSNLIANAINYGDEHSTIEIKIIEETDQTQITITNQGETIDAKHLPHLFERFYRTDSSRTNNSEGAGLGLAITAAIIAAHQGKITVSSEQRQTCFTLRFKNKHTTS